MRVRAVSSLCPARETRSLPPAALTRRVCPKRTARKYALDNFNPRRLIFEFNEPLGHEFCPRRVGAIFEHSVNQETQRGRGHFLEPQPRPQPVIDDPRSVSEFVV